MLKARKKKSETIAGMIRENLLGHPLPAGTPVASSREIARKYKVSLSTADQALNLLVQEDFLYRTKGSGTFLKLDSYARPLRIGVADQIVSSQYLSPEINRILNMHFEIAGQNLIERGCQLELLSYNSMRQKNLTENMDGLLVSINYMDPEARHFLKETGLPIVVYRHHQSEPECSCVYYDYVPGIVQALDHLKLLKNDRIFLVYELTQTGRYFYKLWKELLLARGIIEEYITSYEIPVDERELSCYRLVRVNSSKFKDSVILTCNDEVASNLINALTLENYSCGKDYRLVGAGDRESYGFVMGNQGQVIASIHVPIETMAKEAAKLLLYKITNKVEYNCQIKIPTSFVPRLSSGSNNLS